MEQHTPRLVEALQDVRISAVAAGDEHSLVLSEGKVYSFGSAGHGELGHGNAAAQLTMPCVVAGLQGVRVRMITAGENTSHAVTSDGEVSGGVHVALWICPGSRTRGSGWSLRRTSSCHSNTCEVTWG